MKRRLYFLAVIIFLITSVYANTCSQDSNCDATHFCDETNTTATGLPQCSEPTKTACGQSIACTAHSDCSGIGIGQCYKGICVADSTYGEIGEPCQLDADCAPYKCIAGACYDVFLQCSSDLNCPFDDGCYNGFCTHRNNGMACNSNNDCKSRLCDSVYNICTQCDSSWHIDGGGNIDSTEYCDIYNYKNCTIDNFYSRESDVLGIPVPIITPKKENGDHCDEDSCCLSLNCVGDSPNKICMSALNPTITVTTDYCINYSTRDLTTNWFDGMPNAYDSPNTTFFEEMFNRTNLTVLIPFNSTLGCVNETHYAFYRESDVGQRIMMVWFYDPINSEVCYFRQQNTAILWKCLPESLEQFDSSNSTHTYNNRSFLTADSEAAIASTGSYRFLDAGGCASRYGATITYMRRISFTDASADVMVFACGTAGATCTAFGYYSYDSTVFGQHSIVAGNNRLDGTSVVSYTTDRVSRNNDDDKQRVAINSDLTTANSYYRWGWTRGIYQDISTPSTGWSTQFIASELSPEYYDCCESNSDCGTGFCCNTQHACYFCNTGGTTVLSLTTDSQTIGINQSTLITARITSGTLPLANKYITFDTETGGGSITGSCTTDADGRCQVLYHAPATTGRYNITASFAGDINYQSASSTIIMTVSASAYSLTVMVIDANTTKPLGNAIVRDIHGVLSPSQLTTLYILGIETGIVKWNNLAATPTSYTVEVSREGYVTALVTVYTTAVKELNVVYLERGQGSYGTEDIPLPDISLISPIPKDVGDVTSGLNELTRWIFGRLFPWIFILVLFFLALGVVRGILNYVSQ